MGSGGRLRTTLDNVRRSDSEITPPLVVAGLYVVPPVLLLLVANDFLPLVVAQVATVLVVLNTVAGGVWLKGYHFEDFTPEQFDVGAPIAELENEVWSRPDDDSRDEGWLLEYEQISEEIRTYNSLAVRSTYFSLATLALLGSVFFTEIDSLFQPFVAGFGIAISFAFSVVAEKNILLRDILRSRQRFLETSSRFEGTLTAGRTWTRGLDYGKFPAADLGVQLVDFNKFWMYLWILAYHASTTYTAFFVLPRV